MPTFSIYSPTGDPSDTPPGPTLAVPVLAIDQAIVSVATTLPAPTLASPAATMPTPPSVVMRLPDLAATPAHQAARRSSLADAIYWAIIFVGSTIAVWLIWRSDQRPNSARPEAPPTSSRGLPRASLRETPRANPEIKPAVTSPPEVLYTASGVNAWNGPTSSRQADARPGEAAPVGTIINMPINMPVAP